MGMMVSLFSDSALLPRIFLEGLLPLRHVLVCVCGTTNQSFIIAVSSSHVHIC